MRQITIIRVETVPDSVLVTFPESSDYFPGKVVHKDDTFTVNLGHGWVATIKKEE